MSYTPHADYSSSSVPTNKGGFMDPMTMMTLFGASGGGGSPMSPLSAIGGLGGKKKTNTATSGDAWTGGNTFSIGMNSKDKENLLIASVIIAALYLLR